MAVHVVARDAVVDTVSAGADSVEHGADVDDETLAEMARRGTVWVPTVDHNRYYIDAKDEFGFAPESVGPLKDYIERSLASVAKGVKLGAADNWRRGRKQADVWGRPPGPWVWLERGTGPHLIARKRGGAKARRVGRLRVGGDWVIGPVHHPGTRPQRTWTRVRRRSPAVIRRAAVAELHKVVRGG